MSNSQGNATLPRDTQSQLPGNSQISCITTSITTFSTSPQTVTLATQLIPPQHVSSTNDEINRLIVSTCADEQFKALNLLRAYRETIEVEILDALSDESITRLRDFLRERDVPVKY